MREESLSCLSTIIMSAESYNQNFTGFKYQKGKIYVGYYLVVSIMEL